MCALAMPGKADLAEEVLYIYEISYFINTPLLPHDTQITRLHRVFRILLLFLLLLLL